MHFKLLLFFVYRPLIIEAYTVKTDYGISYVINVSQLRFAPGPISVDLS